MRVLISGLWGRIGEVWGRKFFLEIFDFFFENKISQTLPSHPHQNNLLLANPININPTFLSNLTDTQNNPPIQLTSDNSLTSLNLAGSLNSRIGGSNKIGNLGLRRENSGIDGGNSLLGSFKGWDWCVRIDTIDRDPA